MKIGEILRKIADAIEQHEHSVDDADSNSQIQNPAELVDVVVIAPADSTVNDQSVVPSEENNTALAIVDRIKQLSGVPQ